MLGRSLPTDWREQRSGSVPCTFFSKKMLRRALERQSVVRQGQVRQIPVDSGEILGISKREG
jgi:hypothetical protein